MALGNQQNKCCISVGKLNKKVLIQSKAKTPDGQGGFSKSWSTISGGDAWGMIETITGKEVFTAQQLNSQVSHKVTVRYNSAVDADQTVVFESRRFKIEWIRDIQEEHKFLELYCLELKKDNV